jgi:hypothetical protein
MGKNLHLGIDTNRKGNAFYTKTLLITEGSNADKFIDLADERLRVDKLEIIEKSTGSVLEVIDREEAWVRSNELISYELNEWGETNLPDILNDYYHNLAANPEVKETLLHIGLSHEPDVLVIIKSKIIAITLINEINQELQTAKETTDDWKILLEEAITEILNQPAYISDILVEVIKKANIEKTHNIMFIVR